ncbi:nucleotidyltransferase domain-containing protein [Streptomyces sp. NPDC050416]|uniref:nucleotidyltransferase domain-containing protein n=1 Tax=Streptomyces sp. NPDC050416 TaxID=3365611 RepID=UPI0037A6EEA8
MPQFVARLAERLVRACDPDEVLLFGSYAKGTAGRASDVDFLVVLRRPPSVALEHAAAGCTRGAVPVDTLLLAREELVALARDEYGFIGGAIRSAQPLYVRPGTKSVLNEVIRVRSVID